MTVYHHSGNNQACECSNYCSVVRRAYARPCFLACSYILFARCVSDVHECRLTASSDVGTRLLRARHQTARQRHLAIIFCGLHGCRFFHLDTSTVIYFIVRNQPILWSVRLEKMASAKGLVVATQEIAIHNQQALTSTRKCRRVALSSAPVPEP